MGDFEKVSKVLAKSSLLRIPCILTQEQIDLTEQSQHCGILFMKSFYNLFNYIIYCAREARASMVLNIE